MARRRSGGLSLHEAAPTAANEPNENYTVQAPSR